MLADVDEGVVVLGPVLPEDLRVRHGHEGDVLWQIKSFVISEEASSSALYFEAELMHQKHYNSAFQTAYARKSELKNLPKSSNSADFIRVWNMNIVMYFRTNLLYRVK